jgi:sulfoacetaldehyde acetyltransferase
MEALKHALTKAVEGQMTRQKTTRIEAMITQELGEPFRRNAMKPPEAIAGIDPADMRLQTV